MKSVYQLQCTIGDYVRRLHKRTKQLVFGNNDNSFSIQDNENTKNLAIKIEVSEFIAADTLAAQDRGLEAKNVFFYKENCDCDFAILKLYQ